MPLLVGEHLPVEQVFRFEKLGVKAVLVLFVRHYEAAVRLAQRSIAKRLSLGMFEDDPLVPVLQILRGEQRHRVAGPLVGFLGADDVNGTAVHIGAGEAVLGAEPRNLLIRVAVHDAQATAVTEPFQPVNLVLEHKRRRFDKVDADRAFLDNDRRLRSSRFVRDGLGKTRYNARRHDGQHIRQGFVDHDHSLSGLHWMGSAYPFGARAAPENPRKRYSRQPNRNREECQHFPPERIQNFRKSATKSPGGRRFVEKSDPERVLQKNVGPIGQRPLPVPMAAEKEFIANASSFPVSAKIGRLALGRL